MPRKATEAAATKKPVAKKATTTRRTKKTRADRPHLGARRDAGVLHPPRRGWRPERELASRRARARRGLATSERRSYLCAGRPRAAPRRFLWISQAALVRLEADVLFAVSPERAPSPARAHDRHAVGLGLGVALVVAIASLSKGLDRAQQKTLDPLAGIGTDLTVTLQPQQQQPGFGGFGGGGRRAAGTAT